MSPKLVLKRYDISNDKWPRKEVAQFLPANVVLNNDNVLKDSVKKAAKLLQHRKKRLQSGSRNQNL